MRAIRVGATICACLLCVEIAHAQEAGSQQQQTAADQIMALRWVKGPTQVNVGGNATFQVPAGYRFLGPSGAVQFMELTHNLQPSDGATVFAPDDFHWFGVFQYDDIGHVPDDDKIDPNALLSTLRQKQVEANKQLTTRGWATFDVMGWTYAPFYDSVTHNLSWAIDLRDSDGTEAINYNTRLLGRTGYTAATLVADPGSLQTSVAQFKGVVAGYEYIPDQTYTAYKPGDKVAKYGLAALITGGAVAVAAKTGLWKVIVGALAVGWKFVVAAVVALFAALGGFLKRLVGRGKSDQ